MPILGTPLWLNLVTDSHPARRISRQWRTLNVTEGAWCKCNLTPKVCSLLDLLSASRPVLIFVPILPLRLPWFLPFSEPSRVFPDWLWPFWVIHESWSVIAVSMDLFFNGVYIDAGWVLKSELFCDRVQSCPDPSGLNFLVLFAIWLPVTMPVTEYSQMIMIGRPVPREIPPKIGDFESPLCAYANMPPLSLEKPGIETRGHFLRAKLDRNSMKINGFRLLLFQARFHILFL